MLTLASPLRCRSEEVFEEELAGELLGQPVAALPVEARVSLWRALADLSGRQVLVVFLRLSPEGRKPWWKVGQQLGMTREGARLLGRQAFRRLKHPSRLRPVKEALKGGGSGEG